MIKSTICCFFTILYSAFFVGNASAATDYRFNFASDDGVYAFLIRSIPKKIHGITHIKMSERKIYIECIDKCRCPQSYIEEIGNGSGWPTGAGILGIFQVQDGSRHLVTTWAASTSYNVQVYGCEGLKIKRVLAINSRAMPLITPDYNGMPEIRYHPDYDNAQVVKTLHWNGKDYKSN